LGHKLIIALVLSSSHTSDLSAHRVFSVCFPFAEYIVDRNTLDYSDLFAKWQSRFSQEKHAGLRFLHTEKYFSIAKEKNDYLIYLLPFNLFTRFYWKHLKKKIFFNSIHFGFQLVIHIKQLILLKMLTIFSQYIIIYSKSQMRCWWN